MKRNGRKMLTKVVVSIVLLALINLGVFLASSPRYVEVPKETATIRLPGEFKGEAKISYNSKYVEQSEKDSVLTLMFKKQGYYECSINGNIYVFEVLNIDNSNYTIDLIETEKQIINLNIIGSRMLCSFAVWLLSLIGYRSVRSFLEKSKVKKIEKHGVE